MITMSKEMRDDLLQALPIILAVLGMVAWACYAVDRHADSRRETLLKCYSRCNPLGARVELETNTCLCRRDEEQVK